MPRRTVDLARFLLGKILVHDTAGIRLSGRIVETEAYLADDPACHAFRGLTPRNRSLFLETGHAYVYRCYGISLLLNVASEEAGIGAGVLLRAVEPLTGIETMRRARPELRPADLARGPGRLTQAFGVDLRHDGVDLLAAQTLWIGEDGAHPPPIGTSIRIGISRATEAPLRFFAAGSAHLSGPRRLSVG